MNRHLVEANSTESLLFDVLLITTDERRQRQSARIISSTKHYGRSSINHQSVIWSALCFLIALKKLIKKKKADDLSWEEEEEDDCCRWLAARPSQVWKWAASAFPIGRTLWRVYLKIKCSCSCPRSRRKWRWCGKEVRCPHGGARVWSDKTAGGKSKRIKWQIYELKSVLFSKKSTGGKIYLAQIRWKETKMALIQKQNIFISHSLSIFFF